MTQNLDESPSANDSSFALGHMTLKVVDENGYVRDYRQTDNLILNDGWDALVQTAFVGNYNIDFGEGAGLLTNAVTPDPFSIMAVGSGAGAITTADAGVAEILSACNPVPFVGIFSDGSVDVTGAATIEFTIFAEFEGVSCTDAQNDAIDEAAIINTGAVAFARNTFTPVAALGPADALEIDWTFTFTGATE